MRLLRSLLGLGMLACSACGAASEPKTRILPPVIVPRLGCDPAPPGAVEHASRSEPMPPIPEDSVTTIAGAPLPEQIKSWVLEPLARYRLGSMCLEMFPPLDEPLQIPFVLESDERGGTASVTLGASTGNEEHDRCLSKVLHNYVFPDQYGPLRVVSHLDVGVRIE